MVWSRHVAGTRQNPSASDQFALLVPPLSPILFSVAAVLVGPADAEDAAQEAILRAWQHWHTLHDSSAVRPWLVQITVNVCRQWHRGRFGTRRRSTVSLASVDQQATPLLAGDLNGSEYAAALDLRQELENLPEHLRLIVVLRYFAGMDATEIGLVLHVAPVTVRARLRRALLMLRAALRTADDLPPATILQEGEPAC
jgi:RNA polymerase sigma-70 factor (ECF subfamily)